MTSRIAARSITVLLVGLLLGGCARAGETGSVQLDASESPVAAKVNAAAGGAPAPPSTSHPSSSSPSSSSSSSKSPSPSSPQPSSTSLLSQQAKDKIAAEKKKLETQATITMPNLVGKTVQSAQDLMQSKHSYLMRQVDATGQHREQVDDTAWRVCSQSPAAGTKITVVKIVTVDAVRVSESCP